MRKKPLPITTNFQEKYQQPLLNQWEKFLYSKKVHAKLDVIGEAVAKCHEALALEKTDKASLKKSDKGFERENALKEKIVNLLYDALPLCYWLDDENNEKPLNKLNGWLEYFDTILNECLGHQWYKPLLTLRQAYEDLVTDFKSNPDPDTQKYAQITIPLKGHFLIDATIARQLLCKNDYGENLPEFLHTGTHHVAHYQDKNAGVNLYFKTDTGQYRRPYPGDRASDPIIAPALERDKLFPLHEHAVMSWQHLLSDSSQSAANTTLVILRHVPGYEKARFGINLMRTNPTNEEKEKVKSTNNYYLLIKKNNQYDIGFSNQNRQYVQMLLPQNSPLKQHFENKKITGVSQEKMALKLAYPAVELLGGRTPQNSHQKLRPMLDSRPLQVSLGIDGELVKHLLTTETICHYWRSNSTSDKEAAEVLSTCLNSRFISNCLANLPPNFAKLNLIQSVDPNKDINLLTMFQENLKKCLSNNTTTSLLEATTILDLQESTQGYQWQELVWILAFLQNYPHLTNLKQTVTLSKLLKTLASQFAALKALERLTPDFTPNERLQYAIQWFHNNNHNTPHHSAWYLTGLLTCPTDNKTDNFLIGRQSHDFVGIDNDHAFVKPFCMDAGHHRPQVKNFFIAYPIALTKNYTLIHHAAS